MKADVTGIPVSVRGSDNATNLGAALLAGTGAGIYPDLKTAAALTVREKRRHLPDPRAGEAYAAGYDIYLQLYRDLSGLMKKRGKANIPS